MSAYLSNKRGNLFDEDDVDDDSFLRSSRSNNYMLDDERSKQNVNKFMEFEERRNLLLQKQKEIEQRTVKSTERSLSYLKNSEEVGVATAEELVRQREQLESSERRLDEINSTLRISQKHIQGIKSVFGGLKNFISGTKSIPPTSPSTSHESTSKSTVSGDSSMSTNGSILEQKVDRTMTSAGMQPRSPEDRQISRSSAAPQDAIDENLGHMLSHMVRLKGMAYSLSEEIDSQNELIDNIHDKAERAERTIHKQNKDIRKLNK